MSPTSENLLDAALALTESERLELAEALIASVQTAESPPFNEAWQAEIRRRSLEIESGVVIPVSWSEVKRQAQCTSGG